MAREPPARLHAEARLPVIVVEIDAAQELRGEAAAALLARGNADTVFLRRNVAEAHLGRCRLEVVDAAEGIAVARVARQQRRLQAPAGRDEIGAVEPALPRLHEIGLAGLDVRERREVLL